MKIAAFGDIHMSIDAIEGLPLRDLDLVIITGDLTNFGTKDDAKKVLDTIRRFQQNILAVPGNLDHPPVLDLLEEEGISIHGKGVMMGEIGIFGCGGSNETPFNTPIEYDDETLWSLLESGHSSVKDAKLRIMVCHTPPKATGLDRISSGAFVGSQAVKDFIERFSPDLCLTGHIHEAKGEIVLGKTRVFNPGMIQDGGWVEIKVNEDYQGNHRGVPLHVETILH